MYGTKHSTLFIEDVLKERSVMWVSIDESEVGCVLQEPVEQQMCVFWQKLSLGHGCQCYTTRREPNMKTREYENMQT